jgi:hypothetical protein
MLWLMPCGYNMLLSITCISQFIAQVSRSALQSPNGPLQFFHSLIVPSSLPVAYSFPSGEKLILQIGP